MKDNECDNKYKQLNKKYKQLFKLTTGIITCLPEKETSHQKNNIVYALNVPVNEPIGLHCTRYRLIYHYHNETWMVKAEVESSRTHFEVLGLGLEASSPRKLACPRLEDSTTF